MASEDHDLQWFAPHSGAPGRSSEKKLYLECLSHKTRAWLVTAPSPGYLVTHLHWLYCQWLLVKSSRLFKLEFGSISIKCDGLYLGNRHRVSCRVLASSQADRRKLEMDKIKPCSLLFKTRASHSPLVEMLRDKARGNQ